MSQPRSAPEPASTATGPSFGLALIVTGAVAIALARALEYNPLGSQHGPGPSAFPTGLGLVLALGGCVELGRWLRTRRSVATHPPLALSRAPRPASRGEARERDADPDSYSQGAVRQPSTLTLNRAPLPSSAHPLPAGRGEGRERGASPGSRSQGVVRETPTGPTSPAPSDDADQNPDPTDAPETWADAVFLALAVALYLPALAWAGFSIGTFAFVIALMRRLGARWGISVIAAVSLVAIVQLLFGGLFRVPLPPGRLGIPF